MAILAEDRREEIVDYYRDVLVENLESGESKEEAIDQTMNAVSDSEYGEDFDNAWEADSELRQAISTVNSEAAEEYFSDFDNDDDEDNF
jgi:hypothetical protein